MCAGIYYLYRDQEYRYYFSNPAATLPVKMKPGNFEILPWGRRREQRGQLPLGGWARLDAIYSGRWDRWQPLAVKIPLHSFMEKDISGNSQWFDITRGKWIQGLIAHANNERKIYIVTITPELEDAAYQRWPRIMSG